MVNIFFLITKMHFLRQKKGTSTSCFWWVTRIDSLQSAKYAPFILQCTYYLFFRTVVMLVMNCDEGGAMMQSNALFFRRIGV